MTLPAIPEIGQFALVLALLLATVQAVLPLAGAARGERRWMAAGASAAFGQFAFTSIAFACLVWSFLASDFSVLNVAQNSNLGLPAAYKFAATWGSHEGSLLLWALMLAGWTVAVALWSRHLPETMAARVLGVMGLVSIGFHLFMLLTSNPFDRLLPPPPDGQDLNPLLQDPAMVLHPPLLYMGYVGFSVAFAFAIAALLGGRLDATWARWSRPWTTAAWSFLTLGIALGSWWAYYELGWGGWWFWDPVENASLLPWLVGTALIHSLAVTEKRGSLKAWTALLAIAAFSLSLLGTFLVRSGVLTSVHAFAVDPARGVFILLLLAVVVGGSLLLYALRAPTIGLGGRFEALSRESLLLANNVLLAAAAGSVLLGTLYPLFLDALDLGKISVGPPYFDAVFAPLMAPLLFLLGVGQIARWKRAELPALWLRLRWALGVALVTGFALPALLGTWKPLVGVGLALAIWVAASSLIAVRERIGRGPWLAGLGSVPRAFWGMLLAHLGLAVFVAGVAVVKGYEVERDASLRPGETASAGPYRFRFEGVRDVVGPNYHAVAATVRVTRGDREVVVLHPEKRIYASQDSAMTEADLHSSPIGDVYVTLGEPVGTDGWSMRVHWKPLVTWIWGGCLLMALGGLVALSDRRYRASLTRAGAARTDGVAAG